MAGVEEADLVANPVERVVEVIHMRAGNAENGGDAFGNKALSQSLTCREGRVGHWAPWTVPRASRRNSSEGRSNRKELTKPSRGVRNG